MGGRSMIMEGKVIPEELGIRPTSLDGETPELRRCAVPYYDYHCKECGKAFTVKETFAEHDGHKRVKCPLCESRRTERVISEVFAQTAKKS
jgi:putative FmdB family regulatory protein